MAKKLDEFTFRSVEGGKKYPWDSWLDGGICELGPEDFGGTDAKYVAHQARNAAKRRGLKVRVSLNEREQSVILQSSEMNDDEIAEEMKKVAAKNEPQEEPREQEQPQKGKGRKGKKGEQAQ